jgi:hypothetical protein
MQKNLNVFRVLVFLVEQGESASGSPSSLNEGVSCASNIPLGRQPNPNNPMEYCSTIPPLEQAASVLRQPPPSVLVPVGVLKREGEFVADKYFSAYTFLPFLPFYLLPLPFCLFTFIVENSYCSLLGYGTI